MPKPSLQSYFGDSSNRTITQHATGSLSLTQDNNTLQMGRNENGTFYVTIQSPHEDWDEETKNYPTETTSINVDARQAYAIYLYFREKFGP